MLRFYLATILIVVTATLGFITIYTQINLGSQRRGAEHKDLSNARIHVPLLIFICAMLIFINQINAGLSDWLFWALLNVQVIVLVYANLLIPSLLDFMVIQAVGLTLFVIDGTLTLGTVPMYLLACLVVYAERWYGEVLKRHHGLYLLPPLGIGAWFWLVAGLTPHLPHHELPPMLATVNFIAFCWAYFALWNYDRYQRKDQQVLATLTHQVQYDALTGIRNWSMFQRDFTAAYAHTQPLALIVFDLDRFKQINDTQGHLAGNQALMHVAAQLQPYLKTCDPHYHLYRTGGEEFAIVLPEVDHDQALAIAMACQHHLGADPVRFADTEFTLSASFGVAMATPADGNATAVFQRADHYLYQSKRRGRNRITIEDQPTEI